MTTMADLKGVITRLDSAVERADELRPYLDAIQIEGVDRLKRDAEELREGLDALTLDAPTRVLEIMEGTPLPPDIQRQLDDSYSTLAAAADGLETWLAEIDE